jgi:hypothetical protein
MSFTRSGGAPPALYTAVPVVRVTTSYTALATDYYIGVNGAGVTVTLPLGSTTYPGKTYVVKGESGNTFNVQTSGPDRIDGSATVTATTGYTALTFLWAGSLWSVI